VDVVRLEQLPLEGLEPLLVESGAQGFALLARLVTDTISLCLHLDDLQLLCQKVEDGLYRLVFLCDKDIVMR
jgi:hypothetical protein